MKRMICFLFVLLLAVCPLVAYADGLTAEMIDTDGGKAVIFTDEEGDTYLLIIGEDGVTATKVSGGETGSAAYGEPCWRCGESLWAGDHTAGSCGYKFHSACMDPYFKDELGHELCAICGKCMYSSGSRHGIGFGLCGAAIMQEITDCANCGQEIEEHRLHGDKDAPTDKERQCWLHCWIEDDPHEACAICGKPLCNGEEHSEQGCAKTLQSVG